MYYVLTIYKAVVCVAKLLACRTQVVLLRTQRLAAEPSTGDYDCQKLRYFKYTVAVYLICWYRACSMTLNQHLQRQSEQSKIQTT